MERMGWDELGTKKSRLVRIGRHNQSISSERDRQAFLEEVQETDRHSKEGRSLSC